MVSSDPIHQALGSSLAQLHAANSSALERLSMADRLHHWLAQPAQCPPSLAHAIEKAIVPLVPLYSETQFVHGDWGTANVLVPHDDPFRIVKIIDFEDSHRGDPAEDFKWQLTQGGPPWPAFQVMATAYAHAGGSLGPNASERLVIRPGFDGGSLGWCSHAASG